MGKFALNLETAARAQLVDKIRDLRAEVVNLTDCYNQAVRECTRLSEQLRKAKKYIKEL